MVNTIRADKDVNIPLVLVLKRLKIDCKENCVQFGGSSDTYQLSTHKPEILSNWHIHGWPWLMLTGLEIPLHHSSL